MLLDLGIDHVGVTAKLLLGDQIVQLSDRQGLNRFLVTIEISDCQVDDRVKLISGLDMVLKTLGVVTDEILVEPPPTGRTVPNRCLSGKLADKLVVLDVLKGETISSVVPGPERLDKNELPGVNLVMYVIGTERVPVLDVSGLELNSGGRTMRSARPR